MSGVIGLGFRIKKAWAVMDYGTERRRKAGRMTVFPYGVRKPFSRFTDCILAERNPVMSVAAAVIIALLAFNSTADGISSTMNGLSGTNVFVRIYVRMYLCI